MFGMVGLMGLLILAGSSTYGLAKTSEAVAIDTPSGGPMLGINLVVETGVQLAHHTEAEWQEFLRKRRAKKKRLRRQRLHNATRSKKKTRRASKRSKKRRKVALAKRAKSSAVKKRAELFERRKVDYKSKEKPGTVIVETSTKHLYYVVNNNSAIRYGVAVGKQGFSWSGTSTVKRKVEWPTWYPPKAMIKRKPSLKKWANGQPGGPKNPLGAAALYLFQGQKDTLYRIHGTNAPSSIGTASSSGCIRMRNEDIQHLYSKVNNGTKVIVR